MKSLNAPSFFTRLLLEYLISTSATFAAIFVKFDGIDGESNDANHDKWSDVLSVNESLTTADGRATGATRTRGAARYEDIVLSKRTGQGQRQTQGKSSPGVRLFPRLKLRSLLLTGGTRDIFQI